MLKEELANGGRPSLPEDVKWQLGLEDKSYLCKEVCVCVCVGGRRKEEECKKEHYKAEEREMAYSQSYTDEGWRSGALE